MGRSAFVRVIGVMFVLYGLYVMWYGVSRYAEQKRQEEWRVAMAEVVQVESYRTSVGGRKHSRWVTEYNVTYEYRVNNDIYTGEIRGTRTKYETGDRFDIKFDPVYSEKSTHILTPQPDAVVVNIAGGIIFMLMGALPTGLWGWIREKFFPRPEDEKEKFYQERKF